jgi:hypothetical protein
MTNGLGALGEVGSRRIIGRGQGSSQVGCLDVIRRA